MGFFSSLMSRTGTGKMMAAQNALVAKFMFQELTNNDKEIVATRVEEMLMSGGIPSSGLYAYSPDQNEGAFFGMVAQVFISLNMPPQLKGIMFRDNWNVINNPLVALTGAEDELRMVENTILKKHAVFAHIKAR